MTDAIITGPGLYVLRNGRPHWVDAKVDGFWVDSTGYHGWRSNGRYEDTFEDHLYDIIRRATPEEAAGFCVIAAP